jgi:hypothetical protein
MVSPGIMALLAVYQGSRSEISLSPANRRRVNRDLVTLEACRDADSEQTADLDMEHVQTAA